MYNFFMLATSLVSFFSGLVTLFFLVWVAAATYYKITKNKPLGRLSGWYVNLHQRMFQKHGAKWARNVVLTAIVVTVCAFIHSAWATVFLVAVTWWLTNKIMSRLYVPQPTIPAN